MPVSFKTKKIDTTTKQKVDQVETFSVNVLLGELVKSEYDNSNKPVINFCNDHHVVLRKHALKYLDVSNSLSDGSENTLIISKWDKMFSAGEFAEGICEYFVDIL